LKYCREAYDQEVTFFIMDKKDIKNDCYAPFKGQETLTAPKLFLKEEFYRTFLMIAGKIPIWSVLPEPEDLKDEADLNTDGIISQILSMYDDLIDLGQVKQIPSSELLKGLLWHICKSHEDPVKAVIKATMIFSYGFGQKTDQSLLCEIIKKGYPNAGIDDYGVDPYKVLFDRILAFHEIDDKKGINLIKNAIFFRLTNYPNVSMPNENTPKRELLNKYIRQWKLNKNQVGKLLSYSTWSESEKQLLERSFIERLAQMYNHVMQKYGRLDIQFDNETEKRNWTILKNKTRERLQKNPRKIPVCSTYLKRKNIKSLAMVEKLNSWELNVTIDTDKRIEQLYKHSHFLGILGWILENQLYNRQKASITINTRFSLFESVNKPIDADKLYLCFQPLKPLSDNCYESEPSWSKMMILLEYDKINLKRVEFLISNTWGELSFDCIEFAGQNCTREDKCNQISKLMLNYSSRELRFFIYQFSATHDPDIVYQIKKTYNDLSFSEKEIMPRENKPYLDQL